MYTGEGFDPRLENLIFIRDLRQNAEKFIREKSNKFLPVDELVKLDPFIEHGQSYLMLGRSMAKYKQLLEENLEVLHELKPNNKNTIDQPASGKTVITDVRNIMGRYSVMFNPGKDISIDYLFENSRLPQNLESLDFAREQIEKYDDVSIAYTFVENTLTLLNTIKLNVFSNTDHEKLHDHVNNIYAIKETHTYVAFSSMKSNNPKVKGYHKDWCSYENKGIRSAVVKQIVKRM